jgi:hypothetical protein
MQPRPPARYLDKNWVYHPSESHNDATEFRNRMQGYAQLQEKRGVIRTLSEKVRAAK